jgi:hypothetical protein
MRSPMRSDGFVRRDDARPGRPPNKRLKLADARRLGNEFFFSAPQLKRDPLGVSAWNCGEILPTADRRGVHTDDLRRFVP